MSQRLGRLVPLRNAAYDYFTTIDPQLHDVQIMPKEVYKQLVEISERDPVTGLLNRLAFNKCFAQEVERSIRYNSRFTLAIIDVDHFKTFNDQYGHKVGDRVLKTVAGIIAAMIRKLDQGFRLGGDEFVLILPEVASPDARHVVDRIRKQISRSGFEKPVTISCGLATFRDDTADPQKLFTLADSSLYVAKDRGRNCVAAYCEGESPPSMWRRMWGMVLRRHVKPAVARRF
jgi:diguanylate cyclase (GGDEF)-like protein